MTKFLIDTDTAGDDVTSLLFGLLWPGVELEAITVCAGNVHLHEAIRNALLTVEVTGRVEVPVHAGAQRPLDRPLTTAHYVHGPDGMGGAGFPDPQQEPSTMGAVEAIVDLANRWAGELEVIAQAPLTNIALALAADPELPSKVKRLWIMGGSNNALGNITPAAEFNFYVDPEAAHTVLRAGFDVVLVPWDLCVRDGVLVRGELQTIIGMNNELSEFYLQANAGAWEFNRTHIEGAGVDGITHPDALMMTMAIDDSIMLERGWFFVDCERRGELTRGYSLVDLLGVLHRPANASVVLRADKAKFRSMLETMLSSGPRLGR